MFGREIVLIHLLPKTILITEITELQVACCHLGPSGKLQLPGASPSPGSGYLVLHRAKNRQELVPRNRGLFKFPFWGQEIQIDGNFEGFPLGTVFGGFVI